MYTASMGETVSVLVDKDKLVKALSDKFIGKPHMSVAIIDPMIINPNSSITLYEDSGDIIFIYTPPGWNPNLVIKVESDVLAFPFGGSAIYYGTVSIITGGRTKITVDNNTNNQQQTKIMIIVKIVFTTY